MTRMMCAILPKYKNRDRNNKNVIILHSSENIINVQTAAKPIVYHQRRHKKDGNTTAPQRKDRKIYAYLHLQDSPIFPPPNRRVSVPFRV